MGMEHLLSDAVSISSQNEEDFEAPRIFVVGCGGAGCNSITRLNRIGIYGAGTVAINTDKQALDRTTAEKKVYIGGSLTKGFGAGGDPELGEKCAELSERELRSVLSGADLTFITVGMGGGTGTGCSPFVAELSRKMGSVVVAIATTPFRAERSRMIKAAQGLERLKRSADSVIVLDNNRLLDIVPNLPIEQAFGVMDQLISEVIKSVTETITLPSLINLDFADVKSAMKGGGTSTILYGENSVYEPERVVADTLRNPLLDADYSDASGALIHLTSGHSMTISTAHRVVEGITRKLRDDANVMIGARIDDDYEGAIKVLTILTGVKPPSLFGMGAHLVELDGEASIDMDTPLIKWR